ncbi:proline and serine-rich protein 2-like [Hypanus sabinus]|uniref:proline and serine-rich protein 2-like n=1 Tax=Hypanus sabinus TaxID=79690 RepID=UPI0028C3A50B|nr:proline and serine-rich protein 2-like [Hypanus sabinus]XP_059843290.1 proline and serine-rich protein 2-like [Hypanus sabinus]XP_059843291.1 proline and serine-rich protein 2-like [Hypanus sabinus]XP_059843292.1 proline and serine-rich protein 2-like [Hypanus sabinus]
MPVESLYAEMDFDVSPIAKLNGIERMANEDSSFSSMSRNSYSDDEFMSYLSREEQECILFFENTLDSLNDDFEDYSSNSSPRVKDPTTLQRSYSENEEIIDLVATKSQPVEFIPKYDNVFPVDEDEVQVNQEKPVVKEPNTLSPLQLTKQTCFERNSPEPALEPAQAYCSHMKPPGSVPTPMVIAQKIAEKSVGNGIPWPTPQTERKPLTQEKERASTSSFTEGQALPYKNIKVQRFPSNISISVPNKEYNNTISKAAVKVQERKAQVLANLGGTSLLAAESEPSHLRGLVNSPRRSRSLKHPMSNEPAAPKLGSVNESPDEVDSGLLNGHRPKVRGSGSSQSVKAPAMSKGAHPAGLTVKSASLPPGTTDSPDSPVVRRASSFQQPSGLRAPGITVQFSGRSSNDESRREALRKLGILRISKDQ